MKPGKGAIKRYYLYGEEDFDVDLNFLHVEPIRLRSGANDWTIRPHAHPDHIQLLLVLNGGGWFKVEEQEFDVTPRSIMVIPVAMVHEIRFNPDTDGIVITAAYAYVKHVSQDDRRLVEAVMHPGVYKVPEPENSGVGIRADFEDVFREFTWAVPGRRTAIMARFLSILVSVLRLRGEEQSSFGGGASDRDYLLVNRYRELLEENFRIEKNMTFYAGKLHVSAARLNAACKGKAGKTASQILHERLIIEAKRYLLYSEMSVAEIGHDIGFDDPAYFSRFFSSRTGSAPGEFRKDNRN